ncbi:transglycosylase domain-containing protein [Micromonospora sp. NPDC050397]|uniref:transglycosylase domain-containing protein n=1 Tax=Micromonospora sp. NPDC050397 TaxID=3364279 RepID=UPI00384AB0FE
MAGRASVRPGGAGGPGGPDGPDGPGRRGSRGSGDPEAQRKAKIRRRVNWLIAGFAVLIMLAGGGVVGVTYYSTQVLLPADMTLPLSSTIYANNGTKELVKLGEVNRNFVTIDQIPDYVERSVASAEDRNFYTHGGLDYVGIARAAWNNFTGGSKQGASTITQQYARNAMELTGGYGRKVKEAVLASKLNEKYPKPKIMEFYLNTIYFGRGAYGIDAAAQAYFGKPVDKLTIAEGAVLAAVIKQPQPDSLTGHKGYDPAENLEAAKGRWDYVLSGMIEKQWLKPEEKPAEYPKFKEKPKDAANCGLECGINTPVGNVVNYVRDEMVQMKICADADSCIKQIRDGGYKITTTIDPKMQQAMESVAWRKAKGSDLSDQPANLMAAAAAINPKTGGVLAYFGGDNGVGHDYAGKNLEGTLTGGHPPGSTFKIYTLAAALQEGMAVESRWDATDYKVPGGGPTVNNAGRKPSCAKYCTLSESTIQSYNVPFYHVTEKIGVEKVVDMAKAAGVTTMWTDDGKPYDLTKGSGKESPFDTYVGFGQYAITVLDHASGVATLANRGIYNKPHFVLKVEQKDKETGAWKKLGGEQLKPVRRIRAEVADSVNAVLEKIPGVGNDELSGNRPATGKTGTWELSPTSPENAHAWMVGATPQVATAVWVGNVGDLKAIKDKAGNRIGGAGLPAEVWKDFMNLALKGQKVEKFPEPPKDFGDPDAGNGERPAPPPPPAGQPPACTNPIPLFCPQNGNPPGGNPPGQDPPGQNPGGQNPGGQNPGGQNPGGQNPGGQNPGGGGGGGVVPTPTGRTRD